ncbi:hypothetical protein [Fluoribacter gormanii]|uniref:hypothetical protein n=1 Tax=Fluoribacter gormanii TaxID=464 RepID=UPI0010416434|nr:hypothetical protein [Fluoribacter gormanii]
MKTQQLRAIYTNPSEISSDPTLLEQIKELAEIGFNKEFEEYIKLNADKIELYTPPKFKSLEYSAAYLDFLNAMILELSEAKKKINKVIIRQKRDDILFLSRQPEVREIFEKIKPIKSSELNRNVIKRLNAFKEKLVATRNQQLILKANSLVKLAEDDIVASQNSLTIKQNHYVQLIVNSKYSLESLVEFEQNLDLWFDEKFSSISEQLDEKKRIIDGVMKLCKASPAEAEKIRKEQSELDKQRKHFESIKEQAEDLMGLTALLEQIKTIESQVTQKAQELLIPKELIEFITAKEEEIELLKQKIKGNSKIHTRTLQAIGEIEQAIQERKKQAEKELEAVRNQQLLLRAQSLVESAKEDLALHQNKLELLQKQYSELLTQSDYSLESFAKFEQNFELWFGNKSISTLRESFDEKKRIMSELMVQSEASVSEEIRKEQSELNALLDNCESIIEQAKHVKTLFEQIMKIADAVKKEEGQLVPEDADNLQAFIHFIASKEEVLNKIKKEINGNSKIRQQTVRAIDELEETIKQKKEEVEFRLQQIRMKSSDAQPKIEGSSDKDSSDEESQDASSNLGGEAQKNDGTNLLDQGSHQEKEKRNNEAALTEERKKRLKSRLVEAISLIQTYRKTLDDEQKTCSFLFFYKSRNHAKFNYCKSLEDKLVLEIQKIDEIKKIDDLCSVHDIINGAHDSVIKTTNNAAKMEITKGGSYFGTSRMLSLQRLLDIDDAWKKGHSKFFGDDFHGLKTSGVVGEKAQMTIKEFYLAIDDNDGEFQDLKNKTFPTEVTSNKRLSELK